MNIIKKLLNPQPKSPTILNRKPDLKLCSNHFNTFSSKGRYWNSLHRGQAVSDGKGWYK